MPRQGRIQSGTGVYHVIMRGINRQRIFEDSEDHYTFLQCLRSDRSSTLPSESVCPTPATTMHTPLCPTTSISFFMQRTTRSGTSISIDELTALVDAPLDNDVSCMEYEDERERSMSDDSVMICLKDEFGITDGQQIQRLSKEERDVILAALLRRHAGVRQLQRLTGIGKNIISNVSKTIF